MNTPEEMNDIQEDIKLGEALARLEKNKDYKLIIQGLFLDGGAIKLTENLTTIKSEGRASIFEQLMARSYLMKTLSTIRSEYLNSISELQYLQEEQLEEEKGD